MSSQKLVLGPSMIFKQLQSFHMILLAESLGSMLALICSSHLFALVYRWACPFE